MHQEKALPGSRFTTEIRAGITTFFTMAYIIAVNATVLSDSGGTCVCRDPTDPTCMGKNSFGTDYSMCVLGVKRDLITATAALAGLSSFLFGFLTNLPVALA
jgi:AGZA family xanthine/uracil permease-like MFS transporter